VFRPELATWDEASVVVTASEDAGAGWIDRWDEGASVRFATSVPDPLAFEREYLSVLTGETVDHVRPDPTITISFDGERCTIRPHRLSAGVEIVSYVDPSSVAGAGVLVQLTDGITYEDLRDLVGPDGSILPEDTQPPDGVEAIAFVEDLAEVRTRPSTLVGVCVREPEGSEARAWLTSQIDVE
jgi:hypothetical protein